MVMKKNKIINPFIILLMLVNTVFSQGFEEEVIDNETPVSPIDNYIIMAIFMALFYAFYKMKRVGCEKIFNFNSKDAKIN